MSLPIETFNTDYIGSPVIFLVECKDPQITDKFIGLTSCFSQRKGEIIRDSYKKLCGLSFIISCNEGIKNWNIRAIRQLPSQMPLREQIKIQNEYIEFFNASINIKNREENLERQRLRSQTAKAKNTK